MSNYRNNFFIKYTNTTTGETHIGYFDWIAVTTQKNDDGTDKKDENGNLLYEYIDFTSARPDKVLQNAVVKKAPIYSDKSNKVKFYYYENKDGSLTGYISKDGGNNYQQIQSFDIIRDTGDEIEFKYDGNKPLTLNVKKERWGDKTYPYFGEVPNNLKFHSGSTTTKGMAFFSITDFDKKKTSYDSKRDDFNSVSEKQSQHLSILLKIVKVLVKA